MFKKASPKLGLAFEGDFEKCLALSDGRPFRICSRYLKRLLVSTRQALSVDIPTPIKKMQS